MITVVTPVSPIPSHPDTRILDETIASVRHHLPDAPICLMYDGVRPEQEHLREAYNEHIQRVSKSLAVHARENHTEAVEHRFPQHLHQVGMLRKVIDDIDTPLMLFVEQDTPLYTSETIDWQACADLILTGQADVVRFYHESAPPKEHSHLMREHRDGFQRTIQFSARPHLASTAYYRRILADHFTPEARTFTEDVMHGVCQSWPDEHKLWVYAPEGTWLRSYHLDGRAGGPKYDDQLVF